MIKSMVDYIPLRAGEIAALGLPAAGSLDTAEGVASAIAEVCCRLTRLELRLEESDEQIAALRRRVGNLADQIQGDW
jgi:hypothetical protein